jgi:serine/threonine-protein kinase RsbW
MKRLTSSSDPCDGGHRRVFQAEVGRLAEIRQFVEEVSASMEVEDPVAYDVALATDEAVCNVIKHGYRQTGGQIELCIVRAEDNLIICIRDSAPAFDPTAQPGPDVTVPLEERSPGGLGIFLMRQVMDEMLYQRLPDGRNELILVRRYAFGGDAIERAPGNSR